jgi:hypothetical protein
VELYIQAAVTKKAYYDPVILEIADILKAEGIDVEVSLPEGLKHFGRIMEKVCKLNYFAILVLWPRILVAESRRILTGVFIFFIAFTVDRTGSRQQQRESGSRV